MPQPCAGVAIPKHPYAMQVTYRNPLATMTAVTASQGEGQEYQEHLSTTSVKSQFPMM